MLQARCADHERDKDQLSQQATQITALENAKSWLERRLNEAEVCVFVIIIIIKYIYMAQNHASCCISVILISHCVCY